MQLKIQNPCAQDWNQMEPREQARYCQSCQKCVVDFTTLSDAQIIDYLQQQKGEVCGRFTASQLNRPLVAPPVSYTKSFIRLFSLGLSLLALNACQMGAVSSTKYEMTQDEKVFAEDKENKETPSTTEMPDSIIIRGIVWDNVNKKVSENTSLQIQGTDVQTTTNSKGYFELKISRKAIKENPYLQASDKEGNNGNVDLSKIDLTMPIRVVLSEALFMGMVGDVHPLPEISKKQTLINKIGNWFKL